MDDFPLVLTVTRIDSEGKGYRWLCGTRGFAGAAAPALLTAELLWLPPASEEEPFCGCAKLLQLL